MANIYIGKFNDHQQVEKNFYLHDGCLINDKEFEKHFGGLSVGDYVLPISKTKIEKLLQLEKYENTDTGGTKAYFKNIKDFNPPLTTINNIMKNRYFKPNIALLNKSVKSTGGHGFHRITCEKDCPEYENLDFSNSQRNFYICTEAYKNNTGFKTGDICIVIDDIEHTNIVEILKYLNNSFIEQDSLTQIYFDKISQKEKYSLKELLDFASNDDHAPKKQKYLKKILSELQNKEYYIENNPEELYDNIIVGRKVSGITGKKVMKKIDISKNTILYGPPGTGKTYNTVRYAVAIIEEKPLQEIEEEDYTAVLKRYNNYKALGKIEFTTFHQSFGYEEFIEGIRPVMEQVADNDNNDDNVNIKYSIQPGIFKSFCEKAEAATVGNINDMGIKENPTIWKVSLQGTGENEVRTECMKNGHIRIGWDEYGDTVEAETEYKYGGKIILNAFMNNMEIGDIVLSCYSENEIDAIGVVTGEYQWMGNKYKHYNRLRNVNWIVKNIKEDIRGILGKRMTLSTVYKLSNITLSDVFKICSKHSVLQKNSNSQRVFIIDEINRGNISKIMGELITLIEPSKRLGQPEAMTVKLPYSQKLFGVPDNVYIIGTMNTADRSIALIDTALRRRFRFVEIMPNPEVLEKINVNGVFISEMLKNMNNRIELLCDREHTLGHAFFTCLRDDSSIEELSAIFKYSIIPLLQEYFYEDYEKIRLALGDNKTLKEEEQFVIIKKYNMSEVLGSTDIMLDETCAYEINNAAFDNIEAYRKI